MPDPDIFDVTPPTPVETPPTTPPVTPPPPVTDIYADQLGAIKNEDGTPKYDSIEKALVALTQGQLHITKLEDESAVTSIELEALREQAAKAESVDEIVARLTNAQQNTDVITPTPGVDEAAVNQLIVDAMNANSEKANREANVDLVQNTLISKYGDKAADVISAKAIELGITKEALREMSSANPKVALALFEVVAPNRDMPTSTSVNLERGPQEPAPVERPKKSLLMGATSKEQAAFMAEITNSVYKKHNVET